MADLTGAVKTPAAAAEPALSDAERPKNEARRATKKLKLIPPPRWHRGAELLLRIFALSAVAAIALIFIFVAKEALPLFYDHEVKS